MVDRIACFLTCGYTEAGTMQFFLKKINSKYEYKQYLPNKTIKKKGDLKSISSAISGLTGDKLLEKVYEILDKHRKEISECKAILIEDDLDGSFHNLTDEEIETHNSKIIEKVHEILGVDLPVFLLYASPEAESWFVADWSNGYEYLYTSSNVVSDLAISEKQFFSHHLKLYLETNVLKEYSTDIEEYGWFDGKYFKLSDQIIKTIEFDVKEYISRLENASEDMKNNVVHSRDLYYSKRLHGGVMLKNINPEILASKCRHYFGRTYHQLVDA